MSVKALLAASLALALPFSSIAAPTFTQQPLPGGGFTGEAAPAKSTPKDWGVANPIVKQGEKTPEAKKAAEQAATGAPAKSAGMCGGLTVANKSLDAAQPKRLKKLERWCGKDGKAGGELRKELAALKEKFGAGSCAELTGAKGMSGAKATNLDVKGAIAKAEKRLAEACGAYKKYLDGANALCKRYGAAAGGIKAQGASGAENNQAALCEAGKRSGTAAGALKGLQADATSLAKKSRDSLSGLKAYDDPQMKKILGDLKIDSRMTMNALNRQANLKKAERAKEAASSSNGKAIGFASSSDVKSFYQRVEACTAATELVNPFLKKYQEMASDLNYFPMEADQMANDFGDQQKAQSAQATSLASSADKLGAASAKGCDVAVAAAAKKESGVSEAPKKKEETDTKAASQNPPPAATAATDKPAVKAAKEGSLEKTAEEYKAKNGKPATSAPAGAGESAIGSVLNMEQKKPSTSGSAVAPGSFPSPEALAADSSRFPADDQLRYRVGRETMRLNPMQSGESNDAYAARVQNGTPTGAVVTIADGTQWQVYKSPKIVGKGEFLLPVKKK